MPLNKNSLLDGRISRHILPVVLPLFERPHECIMFLATFTGFLGLNNSLEVGDVGTALAVGCLSFTFVRALCVPVARTFFAGGVSGLHMVRAAFHFGGHMAALKLMGRYTEDPDDAADFLSILQTMTCNDVDMSYLVREVGGVEITVATMKKFALDHESVACSGCGFLMNVCGYSDETDANLMNSGAITVLVQAMKAWPDDERTQCFACSALAMLASSGNDAIKKKIIDVGGLVALAEARTKHQNDVRVKKPSSHALAKLVDL